VTVPSAARVTAVLLADVRSRMRRPAVAVLMAASAVFAVLLIPDPAPGRGLVKIGGARALYTSPTLAFATATLLSLVISFFGFYVVSHALERDARARLAGVLAASPVSNLEYLAGKLLGSVALLSIVAIGFMLAAMAMQVVRGEGPLEPGTYLVHYLVLTGPCIAWVAVLALVFECAPGLAGRFGDFAYLVVWGASVPLSMEGWKAGGPFLGRMLDIMGIGFVVSEVERVAGTEHFTIGYAPGDAAVPPILFPGLSFPPEALAARALSLAPPLLLLPLALLLFRRFDPARTKPVRGARRRWLPAFAERLAAAALRLPLSALARVAPDIALTFRERPMLGLVGVLGAVLSPALPAEQVREGMLPVAFALLSVALADVATRERASGLAGIVFAAPHRRDRFAAWKLGTALGVALVIAGVPALRVAVADPPAGLSALIGLLFLACAAVALGIASGTPKTFVALALALWYLALNAKGKTPALDYGGWWSSAPPRVQAGWLTAAAAAALLAVVAHRQRLARES
jgi:ABC-type transport system involved in multi-copper enzyme maturation permease subunit